MKETKLTCLVGLLLVCAWIILDSCTSLELFPESAKGNTIASILFAVPFAVLVFFTASGITYLVTRPTENDNILDSGFNEL